MVKKFLKQIVCISIFIVLSFGQVVYATTYDLEAYKSALEEIKKQKKEVQSSIKNLEKLKKNTTKYVQQLDSTLSDLDTQVDKIDGMINESKENIQKLEVDLADTSDLAKKQYEDMKIRIKYMYEKGDTSYLDMIFSSDNWLEALNKAEYITDITKYDRKKLNEYQSSLLQIQRDKESLTAENERLQTLQVELVDRQDSIQTLINDKSKELSSYTTQINTESSRLKEIEEAEKAEEAAMKAIEDAITAQAREEELKKYGKAGEIMAGFIWPLPDSSNITSRFGNRTSPTKGASTNHQGIDIAAKTGTKIIAAQKGVVVLSKYSESAGNYVMINHGDGVFTVYMHMSKRMATVGQEVNKGDQIGKVGSTGYSTGPHLHFGIRKDGVYLDPEKYVSFSDKM